MVILPQEGSGFWVRYVDVRGISGLLDYKAAGFYVRYVDWRGITGLLEHLQRGALTQLSGKQAGGGFSAILKQAKLSIGAEELNEDGRQTMTRTSTNVWWEQYCLIIEALKTATGSDYVEARLKLAKLRPSARAAEPKEDSTPTSTRTSTAGCLEHDVWEQLGLIVKALRARGSPNYFESLDQAFLSAPEAEDGCVWVLVKDKFTLTNAGGGFVGVRRNPAPEKLMNELRFVFEIDPFRSSYDESDDYFKTPKRQPWRLRMVANLWRCPTTSPWPFGTPFETSAAWFYLYHRHRLVDIPLNVFGAYVKSGQQTTIIPYAIWD
jgi:hypothetical protein